ncbi:MAG: LPS-assembly protein LptD [Dictyoglomaceae bacterium]|nr:LPS-assembly protein LptD [Dictyoglomaceae bacterium]
MENKKVVRIIVIFLLLIIFIENIAYGGSSSWSLKAEKIEFFWETQTFHAYGRVEIRGKDIFITADRVEGNIKEGVIRAIGKVKFKDPRGEFSAQEIKYSFKEEIANLIQVIATYTAPEVRGKLYFSGEELEWKRERMLVNKGNITTCEMENPHYYFSASKITYISDEMIILEGVSLKFIFLPFSLPLFRYVLSLKKEPAPFPQIGFDGQSIFFSYPLSYSLLGQMGLISFLVKHNFSTQENPYTIDISQNYTFKNIKGNIKFTLSGYVENLENLDLVFSWNHDQELMDLLTLNNILSLNLKSQYNLYTLQDILKLTFTYGLHRSFLQLIYREDNNSKRFSSTLNLSQEIDKNNSISFNLRYNDNTILGKRTYEIYEDGRFTHKGKNYSLSIYENYRISDPQNLQLLKIPEITFNGNYSLFNIPLRIDGILGYYDEPTSYLKALKLSFGISIPYSLRISNFSLSSHLGYRQDFYQTGDARYFIYGNISATFKPFRFLSLSSSYNFQFLGKDIITGESGNTPFYFDYQGESNLLTGSLIIGDPSFNITLSDSYNFLLKSLTPLNIKGKFDYKKIFVIEGSTSYNWSIEKFSPILIQSSINYPPFTLSLGTLLNPYLDNPLQRIDYKLTFDIKGDWHTAGKITLWGTYPSLSHYPVVSLDKDLHCFLGKFTWNPNNGNIQFEISLKAIPTKRIGGEIGPSGFSLLPSF